MPAIHPPSRARRLVVRGRLYAGSIIVLGMASAAAGLGDPIRAAESFGPFPGLARCASYASDADQAFVSQHRHEITQRLIGKGTNLPEAQRYAGGRSETPAERGR